MASCGAQCAIARATGRKIHVHGHIPPAIDSYSRTHSLRPEYIRSYWAFIAGNADVLAGHFFGHWHSAEVRAVSSTSSVVPSPSATLLAAPALPRDTCAGSKGRLCMAAY